MNAALSACAQRWSLTLARACAWALLVAGWVGIGSFALWFSATPGGGFALVALWLLALGAAAAVATRGGMARWAHALALAASGALTAVALAAAVRGGGQALLFVAVLGWAALTALASGVVRGLRLSHPQAPRPPVAAAALGALAAGAVLGDLGDVQGLAWRLGVFAVGVALVLAILQRKVEERPRALGCRAGLFDCSLPAWPVGAWRDWQQWPVLLAGLAMLPMMAALPLMVEVCRAQRWPAHTMVMLHLAAMFGPALMLQHRIAGWSPRRLSLACGALLGVGAAFALWAPQPWDLAGLAATQGTAWGLAWCGQLWAPARRGQQGTSPLRAAAGYALLTLAFGGAVQAFGLVSMAAVQMGLGVAGVLALLPLLGAQAHDEESGKPAAPQRQSR